MLRAKGIIPARDTVEVTEEDLVNIVESTIAEKSSGEISHHLNTLNQHDDDDAKGNKLLKVLYYSL